MSWPQPINVSIARAVEPDASSASIAAVAFVSSPAHAANMVNGAMKYVGVGVATVGNCMYAAEVFMAT